MRVTGPRDRGKPEAGYKGVCFHEGGYCVRNIKANVDLVKSHRLRYRVFCEELGWGVQSAGGIEKDGYDGHSVAFSVFDEYDTISACLRLALPCGPFMIENEFASLVAPGHKIMRKDDTVEVSRLCVAKEARRDQVSGNFGAHGVLMLMMKAVYQWSRMNGIRFIYAVTEFKVYKLSRSRGFPFKLIGKPTVMPDRVVAVAMLMDWDDFRLANGIKRPRLMEWYNEERDSFQR